MGCAGNDGTGVKNSSDNYILAEFDITEEDTNDTTFLYLPVYKESKEGENGQEEVIKETPKRECEVEVNEEIITTYEYKFPKAGIYKVKFIFKSPLTDATGLFWQAECLKTVDLTHLQTQKLTSVQLMFNYCGKLESADFSNLDLRNVERMYKFCYICDSLVSVNFTNTATLNLTSYPGMFGGCVNLTSVELSNFQIKNRDWIFEDCPNLRYIDIRSISCQSEYDWIGYRSNYGTLIINSNCSNVIQNRFSNWTIIKG
jgi:surface protein